MKKTCTNCGSQTFLIEMREKMTMPRKPSKSGYRQEPVSATCADCGKTYRL